MSQATGMQLISRLMSDASFRNTVGNDPLSALAGYNLSDAERGAFMRANMPSFDDPANGAHCGRHGMTCSM
jgi:hypothetical protein